MKKLTRLMGGNSEQTKSIYPDACTLMCSWTNVVKELRDELEKEPDDHDGKPVYTQATGSTLGSPHYTSPSAYRSANGAHAPRSSIAAA